MKAFLREVYLNRSMFLAAFLLALGFPFTYYFDVTDWRLASGPVVEMAGKFSVKPRTLLLEVRDETGMRSFELLCGNEQIGKVNEPCFPRVGEFDGAEVQATVQAVGKGRLKLLDFRVEPGAAPVINRQFFEQRYRENLRQYVDTSVLGFLGLSALMLYVSFLNTRKVKP